jgi:general secretion pathway protein J
MKKRLNILKPNSIVHPPSGFTLLEIMLAIFIFAIVLTTLFGSFNTVFSNAAAVDEDLIYYEVARNGLNRMITDFQTIEITTADEFILPELNESNDRFRFLGDFLDAGSETFPQISFASRSHLPLGSQRIPGVGLIRYYVEQRSSGEYVLKRSDRHFLIDAEEDQDAFDPVLLNRLKSFQVVYFDEEGDEYEQWDSDADDYEYATPSVILIKFELGNDTISHFFETKIALPLVRQNLEKG